MIKFRHALRSLQCTRAYTIRAYARLPLHQAPSPRREGSVTPATDYANVDTAVAPQVLGGASARSQITTNRRWWRGASCTAWNSALVTSLLEKNEVSMKPASRVTLYSLPQSVQRDRLFRILYKHINE